MINDKLAEIVSKKYDDVNRKEAFLQFAMEAKELLEGYKDGKFINQQTEYYDFAEMAQRLLNRYFIYDSTKSV